jgi:hypothetical protein
VLVAHPAVDGSGRIPSRAISRPGNFDGIFVTVSLSGTSEKEKLLARKTVLVCDNCGKEVEDGKGAALRITYTDARRGAKAGDLCDDCAGSMPGRATARRGRKPKAATA